MDILDEIEEPSLRGRVALVTGAGRGIGRAIAEMLAEEGVHVALMARSAEDLIDVASVCEEFGVQTLVLPADLTEPDDVNGAFARCSAEFGRLDILINNAGMADWGSAFDADPDYWDRVIDVNLRASMRATRLALPFLLISSHPAVIFIASLAGLEPFGNMAAYVASKHGMVGFAGSLFADVREHGIKVCSICPGMVETRLTSEYGASAEKMLAPEDVADAVRFVLESPDHVCPTEIVLQPQYSPWR
ncbi:MAG: SDR family oxidoreductase [Capsulimonadaceae bacterium]